ncbi:homeobox-leucine zipper protein HOX3-like isoform X2 [Macadamia integrifolia]|uniref:homeobox-leucine zipper protein HOX3-like isoform X2 n=1 Tax=Macadamia integrifolia TaxID=60698 RepID=UPI001C4EFF06|nr:homeobox-leucine zipper protein HOX3-like isoform X2 [Macadamia integrifolia]
MAVLPPTPSCLELTISVSGVTSSPSHPSSGGCLMRDLDINQVPSGTEEEWMMMGSAEDDEKSGGGPPLKKLRLTKEQSRLLEESFAENHTLNPRQREALALRLKLKPRQVEVWFQNRRARTKLKQTEIECEYLKRWFGSLTEENRRLQKEVEELRGMRVGHPTVMSRRSCEPQPASTLSMCPRCERVTSRSGGQAIDKGPATSTGMSTLSSFYHHSTQPSAAC